MERNIQHGKVHNCTNVRSSRYEYEIKNTRKRFRKETMEDHYWKKHKENFTWIECKLCCSERQEEIFKDHIKWNNIYSKNEYYTKPEKLEDLLNIEHYDVILVTLQELAEKRSR